MLNSTQLEQIETESAKILLKAGEGVRNSWSKIKKVQSKLNERDVVTDIDIKTENILRTNLEKLLPEAGFIVEEGKNVKNTALNWIIDPIDQTKNYAAQLPLFYTQIALTENDKPILAHIYHPLTDQLFSASLGNGTKLNGKKIILNTKRKPENAIIDIDLGGKDEYLNENSELLKQLINKFYRVRISGGAYPVYIVTGAIDAYLVLNSRTGFYDQAPRIIIMKEAGLKVDFINDGKRKIMVAASEDNFAIIEKIIKKII